MTIRMPESFCPYCSKKLDASAGVSDPDAFPRSGDITVCIRCLNVVVFRDDLKLRKLTEQEQKEIESPENKKLVRLAKISAMWAKALSDADKN